MTRNKPADKVRVLVEEKSGKKAFRLVRVDTLAKNYQRVPTKTGEFYGKKVPVHTAQGIRRRYVKPSKLLSQFEFEEGAYKRRVRVLEPAPGSLSVRLVVVYGVVRGEGREYAVVGEWYWYLDSDVPENDLVPKILGVIEDEVGTMFRIGGRDRVRIGIQRFEARKGPLVVDEASLLAQLRERAKNVEWK